MELICNNGDQFLKETFLETAYSFLTVLLQSEDFKLCINTISEDVFYEKLKLISSLYLELAFIHEAEC